MKPAVVGRAAPRAPSLTVEQHLLACLGEEGSEVSQETAKALRFGIDDDFIDDNFSGRTVRERLIAELNDLLGVAQLCVEHGILPRDWQNSMAQYVKKRKVRKFMEYARQTGALSPMQRMQIKKGLRR